MKLLRVLQEKEFRAVGALGQRSSSFRVIAATNRNLAAEVEAERFRRDLYYRLNVMRVRIPALRERRDDIPALLTHFLNVYGTGQRFSDEVMEPLIQHDWPGNVRELEHTVQQMVAMNSGPWLSRGDLPTTVANPRTERAATPIGPVANAQNLLRPVEPLAEVEKRAILNAIRYTKGDRTVAAALLGIGRTTLYRKLKEYGENVE